MGGIRTFATGDVGSIFFLADAAGRPKQPVGSSHLSSGRSTGEVKEIAGKRKRRWAKWHEGCDLPKCVFCLLVEHVLMCFCLVGRRRKKKVRTEQCEAGVCEL